MAISKRLRFEILRRDNHACRYCGGVAPEAVLTVDHVIPSALGGAEDPTNLVAACRDCNAGKSASSPDAPLVADVAADALRWSQAIRRVAEIAQAEREAYFPAEQAVWERVEEIAEHLPADWYLSVDRFAAAGLTQVELVEAAHIATSATHIPRSRMWRYFCGTCWRMVEARQQAALNLLATDRDA